MKTPVLRCPYCCGADLVIDQIDTKTWAIVCNSCKAIGPYHPGQAPLEAIGAWNQRPPEAIVPIRLDLEAS